MQHMPLFVTTMICVLVSAIPCVAQSPSRPNLVVQLGHSAYLFDAAFSSDGKYLATASDDHTAKLWDTATGVELTTFDHGSQVLGVAFTPDGRRLITSGHGGKVWDVASGKVLREFTFVKSLCHAIGIVLNSDGKSVLVYGTCVTGRSTEFAQLQNIDTGEVIQHFNGPDRFSIRGAVFAPDGSFFVSYSFEDEVSIWNTRTGALVKRMAKHDARIDSIALSSDGKLLLTGAVDATMRLWNIESGAEIRRFVGHKLLVTSVAFSPDDRFVLSAGGQDDGTIRMWNAATGAEVRRFGKSTNSVAFVCFSPDGRGILSVRSTVPILWDAATGTEIIRFAGYSSWVLALAMSQDGRFLVSGCGRFTNVWDLTTGARIRMLEGHTGMVSAIALSSDGRYALTGSFDHTARLWDLSTGAQVHLFDAHTEAVNGVALSPDGRFALTGSADKSIRLWDTATGAMVKQVTASETEPVEAVAFTADGKQMLVAIPGRQGVCQVRSVPSGNLVRSLDTHGDTTWVGATADGRALAASNGSRLFVWDARTYVETENYEKMQGLNPYTVAFSPDGRSVLAGSGAYWANSFPGTPGLWDRASQRKIMDFAGHSNLVNAVAWGPDGRFIVTGSKDCTVRLWNPTSGRELCRLMSFDDGTWVVADADGRFDTNNLERIPGLHWSMPEEPLRPLPVEIFLREYYEPRLLLRLLNGERMSAVRPLGSLNRVQPTVAIQEIVASRSMPGRVDVTVAVQDVVSNGRHSGVYDVRLFRNGQLVGAAPDAPGPLAVEPATGGKVLKFPGIRIPRSTAGTPLVFSAYAFNSDQVKSLTARKSYSVPEGGSPPERRAYVVSIGVNASEDPSLNLRFAANDARRTNTMVVERLLKSGRFSDVVPVLVVSDAGTEKVATKARIKAVFDILAGKSVDTAQMVGIANAARLRAADPDDLVLVSFSGHGYADGHGGFYLVPHDVGDGAKSRIAELTGERALELASSQGRQSILRRCISNDELGLWLRDVDAGDLALIIDACQSAAVTGEGFKPGPMGSRGLGQLAYDKGLRILAATQEDNVALEVRSLQQGLLTYALVVNGLESREADFNPKDGVIGLAEWLQYAVERVPTLFGEMRSGKVRSAAGGDAPRILMLSGSDAVQKPALFDFSRRPDTVVLP